ncbi:transposase, partial [Nesterenkonia sp. MY13]
TSTPKHEPNLRRLDKHRRFNGRLEHLRGTALGFRNLTNYITRALLDTGGFRPLLHPHLR